MPHVLIGMGSNINPEKHLIAASLAIREVFESAQFSSVYRSKAVGMEGDDFLNACCLFQHDLAEEDLLSWLKSLEDKHSRDRSSGSWRPRTLDLDILKIDEQVCDDDLYLYAHVFVPASELIHCTPASNAIFAAVKKVDLTL